jgi:hypothetical protein
MRAGRGLVERCLGAINVSSIQKCLTGLSARTGRSLARLRADQPDGHWRQPGRTRRRDGLRRHLPHTVRDRGFGRAEKLPGWVVAVTLGLSPATSGLMGWTPNLGGQISYTEIRADFKATAKTEIEGKQKTRGKKITNDAPVIFSRAPVEVYNRQ